MLLKLPLKKYVPLHAHYVCGMPPFFCATDNRHINIISFFKILVVMENAMWHSLLTTAKADVFCCCYCVKAKKTQLKPNSNGKLSLSYFTVCVCVCVLPTLLSVCCLFTLTLVFLCHATSAWTVVVAAADALDVRRHIRIFVL